MLEAGVTDALCPDEDAEPLPVPSLRAVTLHLAHAARTASPRRLALAAGLLDAVLQGPLPETVTVSEPEGFAFYALYPEAYAKAGRRFLRAARPARATVLGLRSIGTTLAAVVAAELEAAGIPVRGLSLRPRGHPFDREARLGSALRRALEEGAGGHVLVVDEGPGISGSSFACAAAAATQAGVPDDRVALFPSWDAPASALRSEAARERWTRHARWTVPFEETGIVSRLAARWGSLEDLSGGLWRRRWPPATPPAIDPRHERRKLLAPQAVLKFTGLGARGERMRARAERQAEAGLAPGVLGLSDGFLALAPVAGRPASPGDLGAGLIDAMARHVAALAREEAGPVRAADLLAMIRQNLPDAVGASWLNDQGAVAATRPAILGDGRMLPHEWLLTDGAPLKTDGLDHHDDHFWPGAQDPSWDLAGAMEEWGMDPGARAALLGRYVALTGDRYVARVLPLNRVAYLAWRLGYASLSAETLGDDPDGRRMAALRDRLALQARAALAEGAS